MNINAQNIKKGSLFAVLAYLGWGFFPIYWKFLKHVPSLQILCHRVLWSFVFYSIILYIQNKKFSLFWPQEKKLKINLSLAAMLLMSNWFVYIYAVNSNQIVESSLGYFINPLVNILLGVVILKEKLSNTQKVATGLAAVGVFIIAQDQGHIPWIALFLAATFSLYGFIKKTNPVPTLNSNQFESSVMLLPAVIYLLLQPIDWVLTAPHQFSWLLLIGSGIITGLPLLFFSAAAQRIPYYLMGFFQFIAPSLQFLTGVFLFSEVLSQTKLIGFIFIWLAACILVISTLISSKKQQKQHSN